MSGQFHASVTLPRRKTLHFPLDGGYVIETGQLVCALSLAEAGDKINRWFRIYFEARLMKA
jgi:hypothetical protein